jgi:hypothetical protein
MKEGHHARGTEGEGKGEAIALPLINAHASTHSSCITEVDLEGCSRDGAKWGIEGRGDVDADGAGVGVGSQVLDGKVSVGIDSASTIIPSIAITRAAFNVSCPLRLAVCQT